MRARKIVSILMILVMSFIILPVIPSSAEDIDLGDGVSAPETITVPDENGVEVEYTLDSYTFEYHDKGVVYKGENFLHSPEDNKAMVIRVKDKKNIEILSYIKDGKNKYPVVAIKKDVFKDKKNIENLIIRCENLKTIEKGTFKGMTLNIYLRGDDKERVKKLIKKSKPPKSVRVIV